MAGRLRRLAVAGAGKFFSMGLGTDWVAVANSTNINQITMPVTTTNGGVFYRLIYP
jgi:hypothetical protein